LAALGAVTGVIREQQGEDAVMAALREARDRHQAAAAAQAHMGESRPLACTEALRAIRSASKVGRGIEVGLRGNAGLRAGARPRLSAGSQHADSRRKDLDLGDAETGSLLSEAGRAQVLRDAAGDGSSVICMRCNAIVPRVRAYAHASLWCTALPKADNVGD